MNQKHSNNNMRSSIATVRVAGCQGISESMAKNLVSVVAHGGEEVRDVFFRSAHHDAVTEVHDVLRVTRLLDRLVYLLGDEILAGEQVHRIHVTLHRLPHPESRASVRHVHRTV